MYLIIIIIIIINYTRSEAATWHSRRCTVLVIAEYRHSTRCRGAWTKTLLWPVRRVFGSCCQLPDVTSREAYAKHTLMLQCLDTFLFQAPCINSITYLEVLLWTLRPVISISNFQLLFISGRTKSIGNRQTERQNKTYKAEQSKKKVKNISTKHKNIGLQ